MADVIRFVLYENRDKIQEIIGRSAWGAHSIPALLKPFASLFVLGLGPMWDIENFGLKAVMQVAYIICLLIFKFENSRCNPVHFVGIDFTRGLGVKKWE